MSHEPNSFSTLKLKGNRREIIDRAANYRNTSLETSNSSISPNVVSSDVIGYSEPKLLAYFGDLSSQSDAKDAKDD